MATLINETNLWTQFRRLFNGSVGETLGDLLQNSQRATAGLGGARRVVDVIVPADLADGTPAVVTYRDRGCGIPGRGGLRTLLTIADSRFADPAIAVDQAPMGLGFYSLVAHADVTALVVRSGRLLFALDTALWWGDPAYRATWEGRVGEAPEAEEIEGLHLAITCAPAFARRVAAALGRDEPRPYILAPSERPALGYAGILDVRLNGAAVETRTPHALTLPEAEIVDTYRDCPARIALTGTRHRANSVVVNWYGQLVEWPTRRGWAAYLEVRAGRPVTPKTPTRQGLVEDEALARFISWVEDRLFAYVATTPRERLAPAQVATLYTCNAARAATSCPYAVTRRMTTLGERHPSSDESFDTSREEVVAKAHLPGLLLVRETVTVLLPDVDAGAAHTRKDERGLCTLAGAIGQPVYLPVHGCATDRTLWWAPGAAAREDGPLDHYTVDAGRWGIGGDEEPPATWRPFADLDAPVFVFTETGAWDMEDVDFVVAAPDLVAWAERYARAGWSPSEDEPELSEQEYDASVAAFCRRVMRDAVPTLDLGPYQAHLRPDERTITRLDLVGDPRGVVITTDAGVNKRLRFYC